jgi:hypothetical protein
MASEAKIENNPYQSLGAYWNKIYCECPRCPSVAIINGSSSLHFPPWREEARIQCLQCTFSRDWAADQLYNLVTGKGRCRCSHCGYRWLTVELHGDWPAARRKQTELVECAACHKISPVELRWIPGWQANKPVDPYFGYPLWLQIACCGETLWAYNEAHLQVLKTYIGATLREGGVRYKWSMMTRLPQWMKSAKNRDAVMKALHRLEQKLVEKT